MSLKDIALTDRSFPYASRLAMLMVEAGHSDEFFMSWKTVYQRTNAVDDAEMEAGFRMITRRWKLFQYDAKARRYTRCYESKRETPDQFKIRVLRRVDAELAVLWKVAEITQKGDGGPAPHSNADLIEEVGRCKLTVQRALARLEERGYFIRKRGGRNGRSRSLYFRPDAPFYLVSSIEERQEKIRERRASHRATRATRLRSRFRLVVNQPNFVPSQ